MLEEPKNRFQIPEQARGWGCTKSKAAHTPLKNQGMNLNSSPSSLESPGAQDFWIPPLTPSMYLDGSSSLQTCWSQPQNGLTLGSNSLVSQIFLQLLELPPSPGRKETLIHEVANCSLPPIPCPLSSLLLYCSLYRHF